MKQDFTAKLALVAFVVPYIFAFNPALLIKPGSVYESGVIREAGFLEILPVLLINFRHCLSCKCCGGIFANKK